MSTHIEFVDTPSAPEETLHALHELHLRSDEELLPHDPPVPIAQRLVDWRHLIATEAIPRWVLWKGPEVVATSSLYMDLEQNLENAWGWVYVHPQHRGSGYGRELAAPMLDAAGEAGRSRFGTMVNEGRPEEALVRRGGLKSVYKERLSRLSFQEVDWDLMESWVARAEERASDYELLFLPSPIDEKYLEAYSNLVLVMNTAPLEDLEEEDEIMTPEMWRDIERRWSYEDRMCSPMSPDTSPPGNSPAIPTSPTTGSNRT